MLVGYGMVSGKWLVYSFTHALGEERDNALAFLAVLILNRVIYQPHKRLRLPLREELAVLLEVCELMAQSLTNIRIPHPHVSVILVLMEITGGGELVRTINGIGNPVVVDFG